MILRISSNSIDSFDSFNDEILNEDTRHASEKETDCQKSHKKLKIIIKSQSDFQIVKNVRKKNLLKNKELNPDYDKIKLQRKQSELWIYIFKREIKISFNVGYMGEAYIYEDLQKLGCFSNISWTAHSDDPLNPSIILNNGHRYYIHDEGGRFDIVTTDFGGKQYYIEVKSTRFDHREPKICPKQQDFAFHLDHIEKKAILANVTNVLSDLPIITYYLYDPEKGFIEIDIKKEISSSLNGNRMEAM